MGGDHTLIPFVRRRKKALLLLGGFVVLLALLGWWASPAARFRDPLSPVLFSADGRLLGARLAADEQWRFPRMNAVPKRFFQALLQYEDRRFLRHNGVDLRAMARAAWTNLRRGRVVSGGSTLTMQVVRLWRKNPRRTYLEKVREMILALRLELSRSKKEILDLHAANAPFGGNIVGIDAAAWFYFDRGPAALSWAEAAFLAVLPNDPTLISGAGKRRQAEGEARPAAAAPAAAKSSSLPWSAAWAEPSPCPPGRARCRGWRPTSSTRWRRAPGKQRLVPLLHPPRAARDAEPQSCRPTATGCCAATSATWPPWSWTTAWERSSPTWATSAAPPPSTGRTWTWCAARAAPAASSSPSCTPPCSRRGG